jgi:hypothetical protein
MLLLTPFALFCFLSVTQAALIDAPELSPIRGDRLSVMPAGNITSTDTFSLDARKVKHVDCEYSGVIPGVWFSGVSSIIRFLELSHTLDISLLLIMWLYRKNVS